MRAELPERLPEGQGGRKKRDPDDQAGREKALRWLDYAISFLALLTIGMLLPIPKGRFDLLLLAVLVFVLVGSFIKIIAKDLLLGEPDEPVHGPERYERESEARLKSTYEVCEAALGGVIVWMVSSGYFEGKFWVSFVLVLAFALVVDQLLCLILRQPTGFWAPGDGPQSMAELRQRIKAWWRGQS